MIISASRRTDLPSCYFEWFLHRLKEEYVLVRNPRNPRQISRVSLSPEVVDGIVFWTKVLFSVHADCLWTGGGAWPALQE